jgi:glycosyltransferase involved in cell wall biosynthesis
LAKLSVCLLTHNSMRTLENCLLPALAVADEMIVVDSGSTDATLALLSKHGIVPIHHPYQTHAVQMNFAIDQAANDWVFCLDSDEFIDADCIAAIRELKTSLDDPSVGYRIERHWRVLGQDVRAIYPVSSPDRPIRLFHRGHVRFNDQPVDDKAVGYKRKTGIGGRVTHDTFFSVGEVFAKLNSYTGRLVLYKAIPPSLSRAFLSPPFAFLKWYFRKGAYRDGPVGVVTAVYAALYSFLKYFRAWCRSRNLP